MAQESPFHRKGRHLDGRHARSRECDALCHSRQVLQRQSQTSRQQLTRAPAFKKAAGDRIRGGKRAERYISLPTDSQALEWAMVKGREGGRVRVQGPYRLPQALLCLATALMSLLIAVAEPLLIWQVAWLIAGCVFLFITARILRNAVIVTATHVMVRGGLRTRRFALDRIESVTTEISEDRLIAFIWVPSLRLRDEGEWELKMLMGYSWPSSRNRRVDRQARELQNAIAALSQCDNEPNG